MQIAALNPRLPGQVRREPGRPWTRRRKILLARLANDPKMAAKPEQGEGEASSWASWASSTRRTACCSRPSSRTNQGLRGAARGCRGQGSWAAPSRSRPSIRFEKGEGHGEEAGELRRRDRQAAGSGLIGSPIQNIERALELQGAFLNTGGRFHVSDHTHPVFLSLVPSLSRKWFGGHPQPGSPRRNPGPVAVR